MKALARYQVILLGEQRHIRCEQPRVVARIMPRSCDLLVTSPTPVQLVQLSTGGPRFGRKLKGSANCSDSVLNHFVEISASVWL